MRSGSLGGEPRWPRFGPRAGRLGVHSVLSLPLLTPDGVFGAMNGYAHGKDAFDEPAAQVGELFAVPAAIAGYWLPGVMAADQVRRVPPVAGSVMSRWPAWRSARRRMLLSPLERVGVPMP